jgi:glycine/D-amino acid oxidase-like deaminating enzyme
MIQRPDGRICIGGARAIEPDAAVGNTDGSSLNEAVGTYLRRFLELNFPQLGFSPELVEAEWTGVLCFTPDGKPLCGPLPCRPGVLVAAGFCGHGMPQCFGVGKNIARMVHEALLRGTVDLTAMPEIDDYIKGPANVARFF